jgi:hypothetical protein
LLFGITFVFRVATKPLSDDITHPASISLFKRDLDNECFSGTASARALSKRFAVSENNVISRI